MNEITRYVYYTYPKYGLYKDLFKSNTIGGYHTCYHSFIRKITHIDNKREIMICELANDSLQLCGGQKIVINNTQYPLFSITLDFLFEYYKVFKYNMCIDIENLVRVLVEESKKDYDFLNVKEWMFHLLKQDFETCLIKLNYLKTTKLPLYGQDTEK